MRQLKYITITLTFFFIGQCTFGQENTIKGFFFPPVPIVDNQYFGSLTVGYEKQIEKNKSLGITANIWIARIDNDLYNLTNFIVDYRTYINKENKKLLNNCYADLYAIFSFNESQIGGGAKGANGTEIHGNHLGIGLAVGRKTLLTRKLSLDFGIGGAFTYLKYNSYLEGPLASIRRKDPEPKFLPRLILTIGYNF